MSILNKLGKKHMQLAGLWLNSAGVYGATAGVAGLYFTDWKAVLQYLPYYNTKYPTEESS